MNFYLHSQKFLRGVAGRCGRYALWGMTGVAAVCAAAQPVAAQTPVVRELRVGQHDYLELGQGLERVAVGDDRIVAVQLLRPQPAQPMSRLLLTPLAPGVTSLMVWDKAHPVPQLYTLQVRQPADRLRAVNLLEHAGAMAESQAASSKAAPWVDRSEVRLKSQVVQVDVKVVELNKNRLQQAGINLFSTAPNSQGFRFGLMASGATGIPNFEPPAPGSALGSLAPQAVSPFSQAFGLLLHFGKANLGLNVGLLEGNGMARVLAEPSLLAISGQSAHFLAGGEVPIPVAQGNGAINIEYKSYGVGLTVSPTVLANDRIVLKVAPESSELDYANAVTLQSVAVPAITTRRADTTVELGDGESFVIGGLVSQSVTSSVQRVPVLSQIPILGALFKRQEFSRKDRELVIVVTPRLVKPFAAGVALDAQLPGAAAVQGDGRSFWGSFAGTLGHALPGFSQ